MAGKYLRVATPSRERGAAQLALASLLVALVVLGVAQRGTDLGSAAAPAAGAATAQPTASPLAGVTTIPGTAVPLPPSSFATTDTRNHGGTHIFLTNDASMSPDDSALLFSYYLQAMPAQGWELLGKGDPSRTGAWSQRWQAGTDAALLSLSTRPRDTLTVELCPPDPYC